MNKFKLAVILGTDREGAYSRKVAENFIEVIQAGDQFEVTFVDPAKQAYGYNVQNDEYAKIVEEADAYFIITPEYNHSFPGVLKSLLDLQLSKYFRKPVALSGVSDGLTGGARVIEALTAPLKTMGMVMIKPDVNVFKVKDIVDENGKLTDSKLFEKLQVVLDELYWYAKTLKAGRESSN